MNVSDALQRVKEAAKHRGDCGIHICCMCPHGNHAGTLAAFNCSCHPHIGPHKFAPCACTCGLDLALAALSAQQGELDEETDGLMGNVRDDHHNVLLGSVVPRRVSAGDDHRTPEGSPEAPVVYRWVDSMFMPVQARIRAEPDCRVAGRDYRTPEAPVVPASMTPGENAPVSRSDPPSPFLSVQEARERVLEANGQYKLAAFKQTVDDLIAAVRAEILPAPPTRASRRDVAHGDPMSETPDFEQIARQLDVELDDNPAGFDGRFHAARLDVITATLRQVWNARGNADLDAIDEARLNRSSVTGAIRSLDR